MIHKGFSNDNNTSTMQIAPRRYAREIVNATKGTYYILFMFSLRLLPPLSFATFAILRGSNTGSIGRHPIPCFRGVDRTIQRQYESCIVKMSTTTTPDGNDNFTTNEEDQQEVAKLKARLQNTKATTTSATTITGSELTRQTPLPSVDIAEGTHKYVLIVTEFDGDEQYIVASKKNAQYHRNVAEPMITKLEQYGGYSNIQVTGGGRITFNPTQQTIHIYGFSYGFGLADHTISQQTILNDPRYMNYTVTYSNDGY